MQIASRAAREKQLAPALGSAQDGRMAKPKSLPPLTPRAREIVNLVVNAVALRTHGNDAEVGAMAKQLSMSPKRLQTMLHKLEEQGWLTLRNDFVYPTVPALQWQNPGLSDREAAKIIRSLK
jgi:DNA-binding IclR family transcriptional regulator